MFLACRPAIQPLTNLSEIARWLYYAATKPHQREVLDDAGVALLRMLLSDAYAATGTAFQLMLLALNVLCAVLRESHLGSPLGIDPFRRSRCIPIAFSYYTSLPPHNLPLG